MHLSSRLRARKSRQRGQSLAEFALVLPLLLLLVVFGLDFGRVFLGWVSLNNVVREAANFAAENPDAWNTANPDAAAQAEYARQVAADASAINCTLPNPIPAPSFLNGPNGPNPIGQPVTVRITCGFSLMTPVVGGIIGNPLPVSASAAFPIRRGVIAGIPVAPPIPTPPPSSSPTPTPSGSPTPPPTPTPTPQCVVPNLVNMKVADVQQAWNGAGFTLPVVFNPALPAHPTGNDKVRTQDPASGTLPCQSTAMTVTWS